MARKAKFDDDIPATRPEDWVGAAKVYRRGERSSPVRSGMTFHIFRASTSSGLFAIVDKNDPARLPDCPGEGTWAHFKTVRETGEDRVGFSEAEAKAAIRDKGYFIVKLDAAMRRSVA